ncbi:MAG: hypothetical protein R2911_36960 [Caldilineaceae bacterium]
MRQKRGITLAVVLFLVIAAVGGWLAGTLIQSPEAAALMAPHASTHFSAVRRASALIEHCYARHGSLRAATGGVVGPIRA